MNDYSKFLGENFHFWSIFNKPNAEAALNDIKNENNLKEILENNHNFFDNFFWCSEKVNAIEALGKIPETRTLSSILASDHLLEKIYYDSSKITFIEKLKNLEPEQINFFNHNSDILNSFSNDSQKISFAEKGFDHLAMPEIVAGAKFFHITEKFDNYNEKINIIKHIAHCSYQKNQAIKNNVNILDYFKSDSCKFKALGVLENLYDNSKIDLVYDINTAFRNAQEPLNGTHSYTYSSNNLSKDEKNIELFKSFASMPAPALYATIKMQEDYKVHKAKMDKELNALKTYVAVNEANKFVKPIPDAESNYQNRHNSHSHGKSHFSERNFSNLDDYFYTKASYGDSSSSKNNLPSSYKPSLGKSTIKPSAPSYQEESYNSFIGKSKVKPSAPIYEETYSPPSYYNSISQSSHGSTFNGNSLNSSFTSNNDLDLPPSYDSLFPVLN